MYSLSRQQLLDLQAAANRERLLPRNHIVEHQIPTPEESMNLLSRDLFLPQGSMPPIASNNMVTQHLQERLEALKRQNQDAISKILARRRQYDDIISPMGGQQLNGHNYSTLFPATGNSIPEQNSFSFRSNTLLQASVGKTPENDKIRGTDVASELFQKRKQSLEESASKKHLELLEAEYNDPKPKRPLSAYNLFFQEERQKMLGDPDSKINITPAMKTEDNDDDDTSKPAGVTDSISDASTTSCTNQCDSDESPPKKRKRYEPHRKMGFESMAKTIAKRWKETLSDETRMQRYQEVAKAEKERYVKELAQWKQRRRQRMHCK